MLRGIGCNSLNNTGQQNMTYVFMEWDISFPEQFSVLNSNLASVFSLHVRFLRFF